MAIPGRSKGPVCVHVREDAFLSTLVCIISIKVLPPEPKAYKVTHIKRGVCQKYPSTLGYRGHG